MAAIIDSSIWVDCLRTGSSEALRRQTKAILASHDCFVCEPVAFELLRAVPKRDRARTEALIATVPILPTPGELWSAAQVLGQKCVDRGFLPPAIDLLIAQVCLYHNVPLITFDIHFRQIAEVSSLRADLLSRSK
jgi:predicted nucleic acid-binding protein